MAASATNADDFHLRPWLLGVISAMAAISLIFVGLRVLSRRLIEKKLWLDDHLIISSAACNLISVGLTFAMYSQGLGLPATVVTRAQSVNMAKIFLATKAMYTWNLCLTKLAILLMYYRIFDLSRRVKAILVAVGGFVVVWSCIGTLLIMFTCAPIQKLWFPDTPGHCIDQVGRWTANAASTMLIDLALIALPIPQLLRMRLSRTDKWWIAFIFVQGSFVFFASVYRFVLLFSYTPANAAYTLAPTIGWFEIEIAAGIIAANLPILKPLVDRVLLTFHGGGHELQSSLFSGGSLGYGWRTGASKKLSVESGRSPFAKGGCSAADAWDWSRCVEGNTRPVELSKNQHRATASRGRSSDIVQVPLNGISVTKDFRRWSMVDNTQGLS